MTTDSAGIVERLRNATLRFGYENQDQATLRRNKTIADAAAHIEAQAVEIAELKDKIAAEQKATAYWSKQWGQSEARAAQGAKP